jgi:hypothetical protein
LQRVLLAACGSSALLVLMLLAACSSDPQLGAGRVRADAADAAAPSSRKTTGARCLQQLSTGVTGKLLSSELDEVSGVVASRRQPGVFWVHNDSGDSARLFAIDQRGRLLAEVALQGVTARDVEDIALLPSASGADALYLADTGDNWHMRRSVRIYRIEEPQVALSGSARKMSRPARTIEVLYEDGAHDVETLLADPRSGDLYMVEKGALFGLGAVGVYRITARDTQRAKVRAQRVADVHMGPTTAGDVLPDGSGIALRNYTHARFWSRGPSESIASALAKRGCELALSDLGEQGEAFGFTADGSRYVTIAEGEEAAIHVTAFKIAD